MNDPVSFDAIKKGDVKAFRKLFEEFYPSMFIVAVKFISDREAAKDIVQDVFIKLWEKRQDYDEIPNLKTFLYVAVKRLCFNHIRDKKNFVGTDSPEAVSKESDFRHLLIEEETYRILSQAVESLPPQSAQIMKLVLAGKQNKEISEILQVSVNTVKTLKYNALHTLKDKLKDYFYVLLLFLAQD